VRVGSGGVVDDDARDGATLMPTPLPLPPNGTPYIDPSTGQVAQVWQNYFLALTNAVGTGFAPTDAQFLVSTSNVSLTNERNLGALASGYLKLTTAAGIGVPSTVTTIPSTAITGLVTLTSTNAFTGANSFATNPLNLLVGQLQFPATQNPSSGGNTLDDYEEGTFTPALSFGGGTTGITYSAQVGRYEKIGKICWIEARIVLTSKGSSTGAAIITGLPFTANAIANNAVGAIFDAMAVGIVSMPVAAVVLNTTTALPSVMITGTNTGLADTDFTGTSVVNLGGFYETTG